MSDDEIEIEQHDLVPDDPMRAFLPKSFGKQARETNITAQINRSKRQVIKEPPKAKAVLVSYGVDSGEDDDAKSDNDFDDDYGPQPAPAAKLASDDDNDSDDNDDDSEDDENEFPVSHEMVVKTHEKGVTSVALDPSGGRFVTGSMDCTVRLHDFTAMTPTTIRAFRTVDPWETKSRSATTADSHPIYHVEFNPQVGGSFLMTSAHPQAKILSRDGEILTEFVKGDMYLRDMHNTTGHISEISMGTWHPTDRNLLVTAGTDSTMRIWDVNNRRKQKDIIVWKAKSAQQNGRIKVSTVSWAAPPSGGNSVLVASADDGSLAMYPGNGPFWRPAAKVREAHASGTWTSGLDVSDDGRMVISRSGDDTVKLWDLRNFTKPLVTVSHPSASAAYPMSNIKYGPNSTSVLVGAPTGHLYILNPANLKPELVTPVTPESPIISVTWHSKINQIVTTSGNGEVHVLYNPEKSVRGAVEVMSRAPKKRHIDDDPSRTVDLASGLSGDSIMTPNGILAGSRPGQNKKKDPRRPMAQTKTPFLKSQPNEKHIAENIPLAKMLHEDPREALLKYADIAKKDPMFTKAWKDTQPEIRYAEVSDYEEEEEQSQRKKARY